MRNIIGDADRKIPDHEQAIKALIRSAESRADIMSDPRRDKLNLRRDREVEKLKETPNKAEFMEWAYALELCIGSVPDWSNTGLVLFCKSEVGTRARHGQTY